MNVPDFAQRIIATTIAYQREVGHSLSNRAFFKSLALKLSRKYGNFRLAELEA